MHLAAVNQDERQRLALFFCFMWILMDLVVGGDEGLMDGP